MYRYVFVMIYASEKVYGYQNVYMPKVLLRMAMNEPKYVLSYSMHFIMCILSLQLKPKDVLSKYDEEISGPKKAESFQLGSRGKYDASQEKRMQEIRNELQKSSQSLGK